MQTGERRLGAALGIESKESRNGRLACDSSSGDRNRIYMIDMMRREWQRRRNTGMWIAAKTAPAWDRHVMAS